MKNLLPKKSSIIIWIGVKQGGRNGCRSTRSPSRREAALHTVRAGAIMPPKILAVIKRTRFQRPRSDGTRTPRALRSKKTTTMGRRRREKKRTTSSQRSRRLVSTQMRCATRTRTWTRRNRATTRAVDTKTNRSNWSRTRTI